jgi:immunity protein 61 of polymorphic toxin system
VNYFVEVSPQLEDWAALAGYSLTPGSSTQDGRALFWSAGGEVRHFIGTDNRGWFSVSDSDRLGLEYLVFAAPSIATVEKYFFGKFGGYIRSRKELPRVHVPFLLDEISTGFAVQAREFDGIEHFTLVDTDGSEVAESLGDKFSGTAELVELSGYLRATSDQIMESYLSPDGKPLFASA